jgi:hypothetical protein
MYVEHPVPVHVLNNFFGSINSGITKVEPVIEADPVVSKKELDILPRLKPVGFSTSAGRVLPGSIENFSAIKIQTRVLIPRRLQDDA